jgi:putative membrane protein
MHFILQLLLNAAVLVFLARMMPSVIVRNFGTAVGVALVIGLLNTTVGFLLRLPLNIITLGLLGFLVRLIVTAIVIKITDSFFSGFEVRGFGAAFIVACVMALAGTLFDRLL